MGVLRRVCDESPRPLLEINPDVPEALEAVIERLHAKDPALRYQSAAEVAEVLGQQLAILQRPGARPIRRAPSASTHPVGAAQPAIKKAEPVDEWVSARPHRRFRKLTAAALLVLLGLAMAAMWPREEVPHYAAYRPAARFASPSEPAPPPDGQRGQPATVIITNQEDPRTIVGSGKPATKTWNLADFTAIEIHQPFRAAVTRADRFAVSVTADDNVLVHVEVTKEGAQLRVGLEDGLTYRLGRDSLKLSIALPVLEAIVLTGTAHATIQGFDSDRPFHARLNGASTLDGSIRARDVRFDVHGASSLKLSGSAYDARLLAHGASKLELADWQVKGEKLTIDIHGASSARLQGSAKAATLKAEGASHLRLSDLTLEAADVVLTGASNAKIRVKSLLNYEISSASRLEYLGEPTIGKAKRSGASSVSHR
jgi:Putative auto-transporter adhesin, head GIN domain